jgi:hypothetical protein
MLLTILDKSKKKLTTLGKSKEKQISVNLTIPGKFENRKMCSLLLSKYSENLKKITLR